MARVDIDLRSPSFVLCSHCGGTGKLRVMQMAMRCNGQPIRTVDIDEKCHYCSGKGY